MELAQYDARRPGERERGNSMNRYPRPHLVSVTDREGHQLFPADKASPDQLYTPRIHAKQLLEAYDRNAEIKGLVSPSWSPSLIPCPYNPHHTARVLVGNDQAWCPRCQKIIQLPDDSPVAFDKPLLFHAIFPAIIFIILPIIFFVFMG